MIYADTSFLFSLVVHDSNTAAAAAYLLKRPSTLALTSWQRCELHNAVRLSVFRGNCSVAEANRALARIESNVTSGNLIEAPLIWPEMLEFAELFGAKHTAALGVRTLDLIHVAAASSLRAKKFLTCDGRQLALARAVGLSAEKI